MMLAARHGHRSVVELLIAAGADLAAKTNDGCGNWLDATASYATSIG